MARYIVVSETNIVENVIESDGNFSLPEKTIVADANGDFNIGDTYSSGIVLGTPQE